MRVTTRFSVGGVEYTLDVDDDNTMQALHEAIALANPRDTCNVCGDIGLETKRLETIKTKGDGFIYIRVVCSCGASSTLGLYKTNGFFWHRYEVYNPDGNESPAPANPPRPEPEGTPSPPGPEGAPGWNFRDDPTREGPDDKPASQQQVNAMLRIANGIGFDGTAETVKYAADLFDRQITDLSQLSDAEARTMIRSLQEM